MAAETVDPDSWALVLRWYSFRCAWCEVKPWAERDHVDPICRGGRNVIENLVPACHDCNSAKGSSKRWVLRRPHPFMVKAQAEARARELEASFEASGLDMGGER